MDGSEVFACPVCGKPLVREARVFTCVNGHTFDIAREGYVNLLLAQHRRSRDPGYSREMIEGRRAFFDAGYYRPLAEGVARATLAYLGEAQEQVVLDAGCGEGYYLRQLRQQLVAEDRERAVVLCGLDISKHAVRMAAKLDMCGLYAVAGIYQMPILAGRVDVLLSQFSPVSAEDFRRVVRHEGAVLVEGPGERHLFGLKELLYQAPVEHRPASPLSGVPGFEMVDTHQIRYEVEVSGPGHVAQLLLMTPFYWQISRETQEAVAKLDSLTTEVDVVLHAYRRISDAAEGTSR